MCRIKCALTVGLLFLCSVAIYGQPRKTVHYTLDELCVDSLFIRDLDSILHINWGDDIKWEYCNIWIEGEEIQGNHSVYAVLPYYDPFPPGPHKDYLGYIEYRGSIYIIAAMSNPDNMFAKKYNGRKKTIITKVYEKGQIPPPSDPPELSLIMDKDKRLRTINRQTE